MEYLIQTNIFNPAFPNINQGSKMFYIFHDKKTIYSTLACGNEQVKVYKKKSWAKKKVNQLKRLFSNRPENFKFKIISFDKNGNEINTN